MSHKQDLRLQVTIACILALLVILNMTVIFRFSAESKEESGSRSAGITALLLPILHPEYDTLSEADQRAAMEQTHHLVRKLAHFLEYALLGFLSSALLLYLNHRVLRGRGWLWATWIAPPLFCLVYAASDEIHQIFSGRGPAVKDVLIDFAGAVVGCLLIHAVVGLVGLIKKRRKGTACRTHATP
ncbi:MAG: VanZ family protein [Clostridia bacterium]|nr:VanZ family protein [Clostridia bacterium]